MYSDSELTALQERLELQSRDTAKAAAITRDEKAIKAQRPSMLEKATLRVVLEGVSKSIEKRALKKKYRGSSVETITAAKANVCLVKPEILAVAAIRVMWTMTTFRGKPNTALRIILALGQRFREVLDAEHALLALAGEPERELTAAVKEHRFTSDWNEKSLVRHGTILLDALVENGLLEFTNGDRESGKFRQRLVHLSEKSTQIMTELYYSDDLSGMLSPSYPVMVCKPRPWKTSATGCYVTDFMRDGNRLIRSPKLRPIKVGRVDPSSPVLASVNSLQSVPLRINKDALALRRFVWDFDISLPGHTPMRHKIDLPEIPEDINDREGNDKRAFWSDYNLKKRMNRSIMSGIVPWMQDSREADKIVTLGLPFYLPHNLDYRGRVYPIPHFSHHSSDAKKALFEFHNGLPLGEDGLFWLKVHVANSGDFGKISKGTLQERADWCDDNREALEKMVDEWQEFRLWADADVPFSFFASACDLVRAWRSPNPQEYVSHIPVAVDGSNSGVQHYSGLLRAPEGKYVGLVPTERPVDLYAVVARECLRHIERHNTLRGKSRAELAALITYHMDKLRDIRKEVAEHLENGDKELAKALKPAAEDVQLDVAACARALWELEGVTRSTVKRPVMTYAYSASAFGFAEQFNEDYMRPLSAALARGEISEHPFGREFNACASFLGKEVYKATQQILPLVTEAMNWLRSMATILGKAGHYVEYVTPSGFPCRFYKQATRTVSLRVKLIGIQDREEEMNFRLNVYKQNEFDLNGMRNSIAPNVIHSCDGTHLAMTVNAANEAGIKDMLCIHDSFATHAGKVPLLLGCLKSMFVELYENWSPLTAIYEYAKSVLPEGTEIPEPPAKGSLDLSGVFGSDYLFS